MDQPNEPTPAETDRSYARQAWAAPEQDIEPGLGHLFISDVRLDQWKIIEARLRLQPGLERPQRAKDARRCPEGMAVKTREQALEEVVIALVGANKKLRSGG